jgi:hypothetical protein
MLDLMSNAPALEGPLATLAFLLWRSAWASPARREIWSSPIDPSAGGTQGFMDSLRRAARHRLRRWTKCICGCDRRSSSSPIGMPSVNIRTRRSFHQQPQQAFERDGDARRLYRLDVDEIINSLSPSAVRTLIPRHPADLRRVDHLRHDRAVAGQWRTHVRHGRAAALNGTGGDRRRAVPGVGARHSWAGPRTQRGYATSSR